MNSRRKILMAAGLCMLASRAFAVDPLFDARIDYGVGSYPYSVCAADLDGDGDSDLATANGGSNNVLILKNKGDGTFVAAVNYGVGSNPTSVCASDLDGDGDGDLAVANEISNDVSILKNNGDGTFAAAVNYGVGTQPSSVCAADLDGDGDDDLAVANNGSNNVSILMNKVDRPCVTDADPSTKTPKSAIVVVYPNPFNPSVTIELYCSSANAPVKIDMFDVSGRKIRTVYLGRMSSGVNKYIWNGRSDSGDNVASGVYFCRLQSGNEVNVKKVILLR